MNDRDDSDFLYGCEAIAEHMRITLRQAKHLAAKGEIPTFKIGSRVCARRSSIAARLADLEGQSKGAAGDDGGRGGAND